MVFRVQLRTGFAPRPPFKEGFMGAFIAWVVLASLFVLAAIWILSDGIAEIFDDAGDWTDE